MATTNICVRQKSIRNCAYLYIGVTSSSGAGPNGVAWRGDLRGIGAGLCRILDMNFRESIPRTPVNDGVRAGVVRLGRSMDIGEPPSTLASTPPPSGHW